MSGNAEHELVNELFAAIDAMDARRFGEFLTENVTFRFGSAPEVTGRAEVENVVRDFFSSIAGLQHSLSRLIRDGASLVCLGEVSYNRHDGRNVTLPFTNVLELSGQQFSDYRIYIDIGPLYAD